MIELIGYVSIAFPWAYGMLKFWHIVRPINETEEIKKTGFDLSNRFNRAKLSWQIDRKPWLLAEDKRFSYLKYDVGEQAEIIEESEDD